MTTEDRLRELSADQAFINWIQGYMPSWQSEDIGDILALHAAFNAGRDHQRDEYNSEDIPGEDN